MLDSQEMDDDSRADWLMLGHALENMLNTARQLFHKEATGIPVLAIMAASFCLTVGFAGDKLPMMMLHRIVTDFIDMKPEHRMKVINYARAFVIRSPS